MVNYTQYDLLPPQWAHWHIRDLRSEWLTRRISAVQLRRWSDFAIEPIARTVPDGAKQKILPGPCIYCPHDSIPELKCGSHHIVMDQGEPHLAVHHAFGDDASMQLICDRLADSSSTPSPPWHEAKYPDDLASVTLQNWVTILGSTTNREPLGIDLSDATVISIDGLPEAARALSTTVPVLLYVSIQVILRKLFPDRQRIWIQHHVSNRSISGLRDVIQCLHGYSFMPVLDPADGDLMERSRKELFLSLSGGWYDRARLVQCLTRSSDFNCNVLAACNFTYRSDDPESIEGSISRPISPADSWTVRLAPGSLQVFVRAAIGPKRTRVSIAAGRNAGMSSKEIASIFWASLYRLLR